MYSDLNISPAAIPNNLSHLTRRKALAVSSDISEGSYITVKTATDLSKVLIYKRTAFKPVDPSIMRWDGERFDYSWYSKDADTFLIANAEQLAGFSDLVSTGTTFENKTVKLIANIDLNYHEWNPIGGGVKFQEIPQEGGVFYDVTSPGRYFSGTFDGNGFAIYGLAIHGLTTECDRFNGLFGSLKRAVVKNVILEDVRIGAIENGCGYAGLFGYAEGTSFINNSISGNICGEHCAGFGCIAVNSSFYGCVNMAKLRLGTKRKNRSLVIGGLVGQTSISDEMAENLDCRQPNMFVSCSQNGKIVANGKDVTGIWGGQLYGCFFVEPRKKERGIVIDHCKIGNDCDIYIDEFSPRETSAIFFGKDNHNHSLRNHICGKDNKVDLMNGLIGKTSTDLAITLVRVTESKVIDSMVIPGTVNTMKSDINDKSFRTIDTTALHAEDAIINLGPWYKYIKSASV